MYTLYLQSGEHDEAEHSAGHEEERVRGSVCSIRHAAQEHADEFTVTNISGTQTVFCVENLASGEYHVDGMP